MSAKDNVKDLGIIFDTQLVDHINTKINKAYNTGYNQEKFYIFNTTQFSYTVQISGTFAFGIWSQCLVATP